MFLGIGYRFGSKHQVDRRVKENVQLIADQGFPVVARPIVQPWEEHRELLNASAEMLSLRSRALDTLSSGLHARQIARPLGRTARVSQLLGSTGDLGKMVDTVEADVVISKSGPKFIGFTDIGLAEVTQYESQRRMWRNVAGEVGGPELVGSDPFELVARALDKVCREHGWRSSALLLYRGDDPSVNHAQLEASVNLLNERGFESASFDVRSSWLDTDAPFALFEFSDWPTIAYRSECGSLLSEGAQATGLLPERGQASSALALALLSAGEIPWMSDADRSFVERFVPWTRVIRDADVEWRSQRGHLFDILIKNRQSFVVKGGSHPGATRVQFGRECSADAWREIVESAAISGCDVAQEVVESVRVQTEIIHHDGGVSELVAARMVVRPFCIDGVAAGVRLLAGASTGQLDISSRAGAAPGCLLGTPTWL